MTSDNDISILFCPKDNPALVNSGYAKVAQYITPKLIDAGYDTQLFCPVGHGMGIMEWTPPQAEEKLTIRGGGEGPFGETIIPNHLEEVQRETGKPPLLLHHGDIQPLQRVPGWAQKGDIRAASWSAVDWEWPTPGQLKQRLAAFLHTFPFSWKAHEVLQQDQLPNLMDPVWLGVDPELWEPVNAADYPKTFNSMGYTQDGFNLFAVFANQFGRKSIQEMFMALAEFHKRHPEANTHLYALTQVKRDWDLEAFVQHLGIQDIITFSSDYAYLTGEYGEADVARMMNMADCVLNLGYEGFGLATIEAAALNLPVIGFDAGATPEIHQSGVLVPPERDFMAPNMVRRPLPNQQAVVEALEHVWDKISRGETFSETRPWVKDNATWDHTADALTERLDTIQQRLIDEELLGPPDPSDTAKQLAEETVVV